MRKIDESKQLYKVLFYELRHPENIENLAFDKITKKGQEVSKICSLA
jgi:hypothetical protein